jgi:hypothetical protein
MVEGKCDLLPLLFSKAFKEGMGHLLGRGRFFLFGCLQWKGTRCGKGTSTSYCFQEITAGSLLIIHGE